MFSAAGQRRLAVGRLRASNRRCQEVTHKLSPGELRTPASTYLVHVNDAITVPLLGHVAEASGDVDPAADVHVDLHGLLLDLTVQLRQVLQAGEQEGTRSEPDRNEENQPARVRACGRLTLLIRPLKRTSSAFSC